MGKVLNFPFSGAVHDTHSFSLSCVKPTILSVFSSEGCLSFTTQWLISLYLNCLAFTMNYHILFLSFILQCFVLFYFHVLL
jgi:hypothetical protein